MGSSSAPARSDRAMMLAPPRTAASTWESSCSSAASSAPSPPSCGNTARNRALLKPVCRMETMLSNCSRVSSGASRRMSWQVLRQSSARLPWFPRQSTVEVTWASRSVDGRIGDLGEELVEVVEERARLAGEAGERRVDAHGGDRRLGRGRHGAHDLVHVVPVDAQLGGAHRWRHVRVLHRAFLRASAFALRAGEVVQGEGLLVDPVAERLELGHLVAQLVVVAHAARLHVDLEHLAGPQAAAGQHVRGSTSRVPTSESREAVVAGHVVARGTQAVAVERGAQGAAVGVGDRGGAVPGFHEHGLVGVVGAALGRQRIVVVPGLGNQQRDGARHGTPVHHEEFKHVVQDRGIRALVVDDGQRALEVVLQDEGTGSARGRGSS